MYHGIRQRREKVAEIPLRGRVDPARDVAARVLQNPAELVDQFHHLGIGGLVWVGLDGGWLIDDVGIGIVRPMF